MVLLVTNLENERFLSKRCNWIESFVTGVGIKVNDDIGHYFQTKKGLHQGDPISPILFSIVVDMLALLFKRAKDEEQIMEGGHPVTWR